MSLRNRSVGAPAPDRTRHEGRRTEVRRPFFRSAARRWLLGGLFLAAAVGLVVAFDLPSRWRCARCRAALGADDLSTACRWLDRARAVGRENAELAFLTGRLERKLGRHDRAGDALETARRLGYGREDVDFELRLVAAQSGVLADSDGELAKLLSGGRELREVSEAFARGRMLTYRLDDALGLMDLWKEDYPKDPEPHYLAGRVLEHRSNNAGAEGEFRAALALAPYHCQSAYNLGRRYLETRRPEEALEQYRACAAHLYEPQPALLGEAKCLRELGRLAEARQTLERIPASRPDDVEIAYCIVGDPPGSAASQLDEEWGRLELAEQRWAEAERRFEAVLKADPRNWRVRYALATALRQQGKAAEAKEQLDRFNEAKADLATCDRLIDDLKSRPDDAEARYKVGMVFLKHVSEDQGLVWLRSVLSYRPDHVGANRALASIYAEKSQKSPEFARLAEEHRRAADRAETAATAAP